MMFSKLILPQNQRNQMNDWRPLYNALLMPLWVCYSGWDDAGLNHDFD